MVSEGVSVAPPRPDDLPGREGELAVLRHRWALASEGTPQVVLVEAERGMGKSALLEAFVGDVVARDNPEVSWLRCDQLELDLDLAACEVLLGEGSLTGLSELEAGRRLLSWLADRQSSGSPTVLAIDDAQWMDRASIRALRFALRRLRADRVLTLMARRPSTSCHVESWTDDPAATTCLRPGLLSSSQIRELVRRVRSWELSPESTDRLARRTAGLPLLVSSLVRAAGDPTELDPDADVPASVVAAVLGLVGAVEEPVQRLVEASAVLGEPVPLVVLGQLAQTADVSQAAQQARVAGLLRVTGSGELGCAHAMLQEVVYDALPWDRRRALHARAAECTTGERRLIHRTLGTDRPDPALVHDLVVAADAARAAHRYQRSADLRLRARQVCGAPELRDELLLEALVDQLSSQDLDRASPLAEQAELCPPSPLRDLALAMLARKRGQAEAALRAGSPEPSVESATLKAGELTPRERDVCTLVLAGRTNREVADELFLTTKTVEFHLHNVYAKLGVTGRQELRRQRRSEQ